MHARSIGLVIGIVIGISGCTSKDTAPAESKSTAPAVPAPTPAAEPVEDPAAVAKQIFADRCAVCHGETGKGDGAGSAALDPKPRDFTLHDWQSSVTDDHLSKIIVYGGAGVGKSPTMPANPDLDAKPEVVAALVQLIRGLDK